jgi:hypothetical protein
MILCFQYYRNIKYAATPTADKSSNGIQLRILPQLRSASAAKSVYWENKELGYSSRQANKGKTPGSAHACSVRWNNMSSAKIFIRQYRTFRSS